MEFLTHVKVVYLAFNKNTRGYNAKTLKIINKQIGANNG